MTSPLTLRQLEVLRSIEDYRQAVGYAPSIGDLCGLLGVTSKNGMSQHLDALERKGVLARTHRTARSYRPTPLGLLELSVGEGA